MTKENMSRRKMLAAMGAASIGAIGASFAATGVLAAPPFPRGSVPQHVYHPLDGEGQSAPCGCSLDSMLDLAGRIGQPGDQVHVRSYRPGQGLGGGTFYWDAARSRHTHNGGVIVSPTVPLAADFSNHAAYLDGTGESDPNASGCWVRPRSSEILLEQFGIDPTGATDSYAVIVKAAAYAASLNQNPPGQSFQTNVGAVLVFPRGNIRLDREVVFSSWGVHLRGHRLMTRICNGGTFTGEAYFRFFNSATYLSDVSCRDMAFDGCGLAVKGVVFQKCRDPLIASGLSGQYMGGAVVRVVQCDMFLIDDIFFIPLVMGSSANGIELIGGNEGVVSRAKLFGWNDRTMTQKTNGSAIYIEDNDEVKLFAVEIAFFGRYGLEAISCFALKSYDLQAESCTMGGIMLTSAPAPARRSRYCAFSGTNLDGVGVEKRMWIDDVLACRVIDHVAGPIEMTAKSEKCVVDISSGGRGAAVTNNGKYNIIISDFFGQMMMTGGLRIPGTRGKLTAEGELALEAGTTVAPKAPLTCQSEWSSLQSGGLRLGEYRLWVDANGKLRMKQGDPASDTDGELVGQQS